MNSLTWTQGRWPSLCCVPNELYMRGVVSTPVRLRCVCPWNCCCTTGARPTSRTQTMLYRAHHVSVSIAGGQCSATAMTELWQPGKREGCGEAGRNCASADTQVVGNGMQQGEHSASAHVRATSTTATAAGWAPPPVSVQAPGQGGGACGQLLLDSTAPASPL